jgi:sporulation protein YlmC with PRC-barrel domain
MLRSLKDLEKYEVACTDGDVGRVVDFLLDDKSWTVRYLIVDAGNWLGGRQVLISPISFRRADWPTRRFHLALTMDKVKNAPSIDAHLPVSRQHERDYHEYYGYPYYWEASGYLGAGAYPLFAGEAIPSQPDQAPGDVHLRSAAELRGYHIQGSDDAIGHVHDFIVDDETWQVRYLVVDTSSWGFGKKVLVSPQWATRVSWDESKVYVGLSREAIKNSPRWDGADAVNREYEVRLYDYYGRPQYWSPSDRLPHDDGQRVIR